MPTMQILYEGATYYKTCSDVHLWKGSLKSAPDWIIDMVEDGTAFIGKAAKTIIFIDKAGYHTADPEDLIIRNNDYIEILRSIS